ncbi:MAG: 23S rRNA (uracil(1939)-C(5))-methyltransferase RlmD [Lachnospiraceae bacterium]|nr:23S rRNA (uracil(1939)-C(5))-methyltransferase RlmD [Lachnospiraceae bacterium]
MKKNDMIMLSIDSLTGSGQGIGRLQTEGGDKGLAVFVKDTVPGDVIRAKIIKIKSSYVVAKLEEILTPSPDRITPRCPAARACGGCQLQMMNYEAQKKYKRQAVADVLERVGGFAPGSFRVEEVKGMEQPWNYRNKAQYPVGTDRAGRPVAGFYAGHTHSIIPAGDCYIGAPSDTPIRSAILSWMEEYGISAYSETTREGLIRHIYIRTGFVSGEILVMLVANAAKLPHEPELISALRSISHFPEGGPANPHIAGILLNTNTRDTNVILGEKCRILWGKDYLEDSIGSVRYRISWQSFYQVNPYATRILYDTVLQFANLTGNETVWDIYCGIGTISLFLAREARWVYGVEIVPEAIRNARANAALNGLANTTFFAGKAEEVLPAQYEREGIRADVMVVDPPRKGCQEAVLQTMLRARPQRIVYVSCDPGTLARDLKMLRMGGYRLEKVQPVDMFPQTANIECVAMMVMNRD